MGLGATKRAFGGLDLGTFLAPAVIAVVVYLVHVHVLNRPFTLSALDDATRQGLRVAAITMTIALPAIFAAAFLARLRSGRELVMHLRRAAGGVGWAALTFTLAVIVVTGGTLGPWPPSPFGVYAPILGFAGGGGSAVVAAIVLIFSLFLRSSRAAPSPVDPKPAL
jgi:predicted permease